jgi:uncharacterized protein (TIGR04222 family)
MNPFALPGREFLQLYVIVLMGAGVASLVLRWLLRRPGGLPPEGAPPLDPEEVAYLAGGGPRAVNAAVAGLLQRRVVGVNAERRELCHDEKLHKSASALEAVIYATASARSPLPQVYRAALPHISQLGSKLRELGLVLSPPQARLARWVPALLLLAVALFGAIKIGVGVSRGRPVGNLTLLVVLALVAALLFLVRWPHRTRRGDRVLTALQRKNLALPYSAQKNTAMLGPKDVVLGVGLFDISVLGGSLLARMRNVQGPPSAVWKDWLTHYLVGAQVRGGGYACSSAGGACGSGCGGGGGASCGSGCGGGASCGGGGCGGCGN